MTETPRVRRFAAVAFGAPIVWPYYLRTDVLAGRVHAGESVESVCRDYGIPEDAVRVALEFEDARWPAEPALE